jgi:hypothetical protein
MIDKATCLIVSFRCLLLVVLMTGYGYGGTRDWQSQIPDQQLVHVAIRLASLFLGKWNRGAYEMELQPDVTSYHARAFPIPQIHTGMLKMEVGQLCK